MCHQFTRTLTLLKRAIIVLDLFYFERPTAQTPLLVQFTRLTLENNFIKSEFCADIYHQNFGITVAMGTPFAVTAANAFLYDFKIMRETYLSSGMALVHETFL